MRLKLLIVGLLWVAPAYAQQQPQQATEYTFKVTSAEIDIIGKALGTQPFNEVATLIQKLRSQVVEQQTLKKPGEPEKK